MTIEIGNIHDPYIVKTGLEINPSQYNAIQVRLKTNGSSTLGNLYFFTEDTKEFNPQQIIPFKITPDGKYHTYIIDLASTGLYNTTLKGIRFDIGSSVGEKITFEYVKAIKSNAGSIPMKLDKTFHTYSDKMHQEFRIIATADYNDIAEYGYEVKFNKKNVAKIQFKDKNGIGNSIDKIDANTVEYVSFDIKKTGVIGFIIPPDGSTGSVKVTEENGYYVFRQYANITNFQLEQFDDITIGNRLYTDKTHSFEGIDKIANLERNPLTDITVVKDSNRAKFIEYDYMVGAYKFDMAGSTFSKAYYNEPDKHFTANITIKSDDKDRDIYVWMNTKNECLESAAILDDTNTLIPLPLQVCKNFEYEKEEPLYDPTDLLYGDTFFPLKLKANDTTQFTLLNLYQNWGKYPLKQISSIQFHISYYHLSTGVTESNCIAPYYVYGKDGWTLPDFRGASGIMWSSQPQFNSVGRLYFLSYINSKGNKVNTEYTGSYIRSVGQTYADMDYSYISDCGSYKYTLRHFEFPQKDENRTYYTLTLEFLKNITIDNVREDLSLFTFDSRSTYFKQTGFLDENNQPKVVPIDTSKPNTTIYKLGKESPYFSYFDLVDGEEVMNFGFILRNSNIKIGGKTYKGGFAYKSYFDGHLNTGTFTLDLGKTKFKKGDKIDMDFILLPYGSHKVANDENVRYVREDSCLNPLKIEAIKGTVVNDTYLPRIKCENNQAEFKITGGRNNNAVRIDGFTNIKKPSIYELVDNNWVPVEFSVHDYDGYTVHYNPDGTYSFSFVFNIDNPSSTKTFKIEN